MAKALTKAALVSQLSADLNFPKAQIEEVLDAMSKLAHKEAKNSFSIPGIGKLVLVDRKARTGRNPATGATIKIPAKKVLKFRIAKACKDAVIGAE